MNQSDDHRNDRSLFSVLTRRRHAAPALLANLCCGVLWTFTPVVASGARAGVHAVAPIIAVAEPLAAKAGMDILERGGTAADAAVAVQAMLGLVEPQSSGLGGGAFMLYYDAGTGALTDYNGRETAPAGASPDMFMDGGKPLTFNQAVVSGRATGVPGAMFLLDQAQKDHPGLKWSGLFDAAIRQARTGFVVTKRLGNYLRNANFPEMHTADFIAFFGNRKGGFLRAGDTLKNPAYAATLRAFAAHRTAVFRSGPIAEAIVAKTHEAPLPGAMRLSDLAAYRVVKTTIRPYRNTGDFNGKPLCVPYHAYIVCSNNAPSGGPALLQGLLIAKSQPLAAWGVHDPRSWQALIEVERLMYADRDEYEADTPLFARQLNSWFDPAYIKSRSGLIVIGAPNPPPSPGALPLSAAIAPDKTIEPGGTTHFVIRDTYGNVLSMTTTIESYFGTGRMVDGFFLNNQLTDFSFSPKTEDGRNVANAVAGGKRPRSSMAPVMVFDSTGNKVIAAFGSPGGVSILAYNLKTLIGLLDWHLSMQDAIDLPNVVARGASIRMETDRTEPAVLQGLSRLYEVMPMQDNEESGLNGILRRPDGSFDGGSDPRREGVVLKGVRPR